MEISYSYTFILQLLFLFIIIVVIPSSYSLPQEGFRVDLKRIDSNSNLTKLERIQRATLRSHRRMSKLSSAPNTYTSSLSSSSKTDIHSVVHAGNGEFLMDLSIGTPSIPFSAILDTGSDLVWTQCKPCVDCFHQTTPIFDPANSSTYSTISCTQNLCSSLPTSTCNGKGVCTYMYTYGDSSSTQGVLATETFKLGTSSLPNIGFGCGDTNEGSGFSQGAGLVGLGRGPLSLISQLKIGKFSYCLTSMDDDSKNSPLLFGSLAEMNATLTTVFIKNAMQPSFYYLNLKGITVGKELLNVTEETFALQDDGSGGVIIDSGTTITYLDMPVYKELRNAFVKQVDLPAADGSVVGLDVCFKGTGASSMSVQVPKLKFHFEGADLELPAENYMILDDSSGLLCLTLMGSSGMSIFGNFQQQNMQILYDLEKESLSFMPAQCDKL